MKREWISGKVLILALLTAGGVRADFILDLSSSLAAGDPTQTGRLSRNGIQQDWGGSEPFPGVIGVINPVTVYHYHTYVVNVGSTPFIQVDFDSLSVNTFVSAYDLSYLPDSAGSPNFGFDTHWLGDAGVSRNFFGLEPVFFNVILPTNDNLVIVVNQTAAGTAGLGDPFHLIVEAYLDSSFTSTPEPAAMLLSASGLILLTLGRRFRRSGRSV
jgi:hypothetical protein